MTATPDEFAAISTAYESAHRLPARALAELLITGNIGLDANGVLEGPIGDAFEAFVLQCASDQGVTVEEFGAAVAAFGRLRETLAELDGLPE